MFTGIIEVTQPVMSIRIDKGSRIVQIARPEIFNDIRVGSSIACNGICLTVLKYDQHSFDVQVMHETLSKTNAGAWKPGDVLNLERALKLGDRLDGHWVMGHVDRCVKLLRKEQRGTTAYYHFELLAQDRKYLIPQGSICIDGTSLTIAELNSRDFAVALILHTLDNTRLSTLGSGASVNLEYDALGKYILQKDL
ncbi:MAG: riboflavin synthase [Candidatus Cloacimonetes bacterium]|nr:riboflavin synthase [Candidatus Cloacimonadota bacterium]